MQNEYIINTSTYLLSQEGRKKFKTKVIEADKIFFISNKCLNIINDSCRYFGSSYLGRKEGTKSLININIKPPIIVEESRKLIFFPTASPKSNECIWISYNNLKSYKKINNITRLIFKNDKMFDVPVTYEIIDNQVTRSMKLEKELNNKKNILIL